MLRLQRRPAHTACAYTPLDDSSNCLWGARHNTATYHDDDTLAPFRRSLLLRSLARSLLFLAFLLASVPLAFRRLPLFIVRHAAVRAIVDGQGERGENDSVYVAHHRPPHAGVGRCMLPRHEHYFMRATDYSRQVPDDDDISLPPSPPCHDILIWRAGRHRAAGAAPASCDTRDQATRARRRRASRLIDASFLADGGQLTRLPSDSASRAGVRSGAAARRWHQLMPWPDDDSAEAVLGLDDAFFAP